ncbi:MAG: DUF998 domain-containing protein [Geodermatophilales bacterium]|nr:DUF998 domain-containing protein [Geodermatophilales bacterium]
MAGVTPNRLRWGALAWLLTLQFFVVETIVQARLAGPYSRADEVISVLGTADSPAHRLMNASFVVQGALILAVTLLLRPALRGAGARVAPVLLGVSALGVLLVGVFPQDGSLALHRTGAALYLAGGGLGLIALAYGVRRRSEAVGTVLALLGLAGTAMTLFFFAGVTEYLGEGGTERAAAYVLPVGLAVAAVALWCMGAGAGRTATQPGEAAGERPSRRGLREQERARRAEQQRQRDEALEAAARRRGTADRDDDEDEDPWAAPGRRRGL